MTQTMRPYANYAHCAHYANNAIIMIRPTMNIKKINCTLKEQYLYSIFILNISLGIKMVYLKN